MATVCANVNEVKEVRAQNEGVIFNVQAALMALKSTPVSKRGGSSKDTGLSADIIRCIKEAGQPVSCAQVEAMYSAATGKELTKELVHSISSILWAKSTRNTKKSTHELNYDAATGCYTIA